MSGTDKLTRAQEAAILGLLTEPTMEAAAKAARVSTATLRRWMKEEQFLNEYRAAQRQRYERAVTRLVQAGEEAVDRLTSSSAPGARRSSSRLPSQFWSSRRPSLLMGGRREPQATHCTAGASPRHWQVPGLRWTDPHVRDQA